jgi:hypothetical protein
MPALNGVHAVRVCSELPFLQEIPVYLLLVHNHFSRSSPRPTTAFCHVILVPPNTENPLFFNHAKNCVLVFGILNSTFFSRIQAGLLPSRDELTAAAATRPKISAIREGQDAPIGMLLFLPLPLLSHA